MGWEPPNPKLLNIMNARNLILSLAAAGGALALSSCVDPYYTGVTASTTTYQPGYRVTSLPRGYTTVTVSGTNYYRHNDTYYRPRGGGYVVVDRPQGIRGPNGDRDRDGIRNRYDRRDDRRGYNRGGYGSNYVEVLPRGYRTVTHRGTRYYQVGDRYYQPRNGGYVIVGSPF